MADEYRHDPFAPAKRVLKGGFDFKGRSRRSDGIVYYFLATLLGVVIFFALSAFDFEQGGAWYNSDVIRVFSFVVQLPLIAWFVRRLHDQDKSGWYIFILPVAFVADRLLAQAGFVHGAVMLVLIISFYALVFWPPTKGANRYGPDPRIAEENAQKA